MAALATASVNAQPKTVGIVIYEGVALLDFAHPMEAFRAAQREAGGACYNVVLIGATSKQVRTDSMVKLYASHTLAQAPPLDTLIIPGGAGIRDGVTLPLLANWLRERAAFTRRFVAVRDAIYSLGTAGLLSGRSITTHWRHAAQVAQRFPDVRVAVDAAFVRDGNIFTCATADAAMELSISLIAEDFGRATALAIAKEFVSYLRPCSDTSSIHFSSADYTAEPSDRLCDMPAWVAAHLRDNLTVEALAAHACLCPRHFSRRFKEQFHCTPADFVESVRLAEGKKRLLQTRTSIDSIATAVGFNNSDSFRRAFERQTGVSPRQFRKREVAAKKIAHQPHRAFAVHAGGR